MISGKPLRQPDRIRIDSGAYARMEQSAGKAYPREACGVLLGNPGGGAVREIRTMENRTDRENAGRHYRIDPPELYRMECRAAEEGYEIAGFWHSHVEAEAVLSGEDERYMVPGMVYLILPVSGGRPGPGRAYRTETAGGTATEIMIRVQGENGK